MSLYVHGCSSFLFTFSMTDMCNYIAMRMRHTITHSQERSHRDNETGSSGGRWRTPSLIVGDAILLAGLHMYFIYCSTRSRKLEGV